MSRDDERTDRAQVVLVAAAVVAVAFLTMTLAYAQLGYDGDRTGAGAVDVVSVSAIERGVTESFRAAVREESMESTDSSWRERERVVERIRDDVDAGIDRLEGTYAEDDRSLVVSFDDATASAWSESHCPDGPGRAFGPCRSIGGVVVQERAGETTPIAAAFSVRIVSPAESTTATVVVSAV
ncbi:DUF7261 family protein [Halobellus captivus]|uniref:DUF7261 family protein n=1 Tax=Halobellus captivus TaxID=2592614 RepID=UPI00119F7A43|nr:hypothetical protein [Halobellus captivus]